MKKPSDASRRWNRIHAETSDHRRKASRDKRLRKNRQNSGPHGHGPKRKRGFGAPIECPEDFSLESNHDAVVGVLRQIRSRTERARRNERFYVDFRKIRRLSPSAALAMAAELDRWNQVRGPARRLRAIDVPEWDASIRRLLEEMGFFDLLHVQSGSDAESGGENGVRYVKFRTGQKADGEEYAGLIVEGIEPIMGGIAIPRRVALYAAVTEAMANVAKHAYRDNDRCPSWWISASRDPATGEVSLLIYDQGMGIPGSLPRTFGELIRGVVPLSDDAGLIKAAHELQRTATKEEHRGLGLDRDVRGYLRGLRCPAFYRVVSRRGEYIIDKTQDGDSAQHTPGTEELKRHSKPLHGTLIEWRMVLQ